MENSDAPTSVGYVGSENLVVPMSIVLDPFLTPTDVRVWMLIRSLVRMDGRTHFIPSSTYNLPKLAGVSRPTFINSIQRLMVLRLIYSETTYEESGYVRGQEYMLSDVVITLKSKTHWKNYNALLDKLIDGNDRKMALLAKYARASLGMLPESTHDALNTAVHAHMQNANANWPALADPGVHAIHPSFVNSLLTQLNEIKRQQQVVKKFNHLEEDVESGGKESLPPEGQVVKKFNHLEEDAESGGKEFLPPEPKVVKKFNHQADSGGKEILPPENQRLSSASRARANVVCSSSKTTTTTTGGNRQYQKELTELVESERLTAKQSQQMSRILSDLEDQPALELMREVVGRMIISAERGETLNNPAGYLFSMKKRWLDGDFVPTDAADRAELFLQEHRRWKAQEEYMRQRDEAARRGMEVPE